MNLNIFWGEPMILYFSGTGNTEYLAESLSKQLDDEVINLFDDIKNNRQGDFYSEKPFVIISPTYGWRVPRFLSHYLKRSNFSGNKDIYVIMNFGSSSGNADKYIRRDIQTLGLHYRGLYEIKMPENYLALFELDSDDANAKIVNEASNEIVNAGNLILADKNFNKPKISLLKRFLSSAVNDIFFKFIVKDKKFYSTDKCIQCGVCAKVCVLNNIDYIDGFPNWNGNCTHCMACVSKCPTGAIEYGKKTVGKDRYLLELIGDNKERN